MTLSMIYFVYSLTALIVFTIAAINIQPFKKAAFCYPSTDTVFYILLSLMYTVFIAGDISTRGKFNTVILIPIYLTAFVPIVYIASLICAWMISKMRWIKPVVLNIVK